MRASLLKMTVLAILHCPVQVASSVECLRQRASVPSARHCRASVRGSGRPGAGATLQASSGSGGAPGVQRERRTSSRPGAGAPLQRRGQGSRGGRGGGGPRPMRGGDRAAAEQREGRRDAPTPTRQGGDRGSRRPEGGATRWREMERRTDATG